MKQLLTVLLMLTSLSMVSAQETPLYTFSGTLSGANEVPSNMSTASGIVTGAIYEGGFINTALKGSESKTIESGYRIEISIEYNNLTTALTAAHIHGPATPTTNADVIHDLQTLRDELATSGNIQRRILIAGHSTVSLKDNANKAFAQQFGDPALVDAIINGQAYVNLHTSTFPSGEIRANLVAVDPSAIPTMGQWAIFILALLLSTTAIIFVRRSNSSMA